MSHVSSKKPQDSVCLGCDDIDVIIPLEALVEMDAKVAATPSALSS